MYNFKTINDLASKKDLTILGAELQRYCPNTTLSTEMYDGLLTIKRLVFVDCTVELEYGNGRVLSIEIEKN